MPSTSVPLICLIPTLMCSYVCYDYLQDEDPHHSLYHFWRHKYLRSSDIEDCPINQYDHIDLIGHEEAALFLYNSSVPDHVVFMHDVRVANYKHPLDVFKLECNVHARLCAQFGHGSIHEQEEPPVMFYRYGKSGRIVHFSQTQLSRL